MILAGTGTDVISDFIAGASTDDVIDLSNVATLNNFTDVQNATTDNVDGNAEIDPGGGSTLTLEGVATADLSADDFTF